MSTVDEAIAALEIHVLKRRSRCILHISTEEGLRMLVMAWLEAHAWLDRGVPFSEVNAVMNTRAPMRWVA